MHSFNDSNPFQSGVRLVPQGVQLVPFRKGVELLPTAPALVPGGAAERLVPLPHPTLSGSG